MSGMTTASSPKEGSYLALGVVHIALSLQEMWLLSDGDCCVCVRMICLRLSYQKSPWIVESTTFEVAALNGQGSTTGELRPRGHIKPGKAAALRD